MLIGLRTKENYRRAMREVTKNLGRNVTVYKQPLKKECTNCFYDKTTDTSTGKCRWTALEAAAKQTASGGIELMYKYFKIGRCPVCLGKGYTEIQRKEVVTCLVNWNPSEDSTNDLVYTSAGSTGSTVVRLKTDPRYLRLFKDSSRIIVDGIETQIMSPPTVRGLGNQTTLVIIAYTTAKASEFSDEVIKEYDT